MSPFTPYVRNALIACITYGTLAAFGQAFAQDAPQPQKFHLELDQTDLNALARVIDELPKKIADPLIIKLQTQLAAQAPKNRTSPAPAVSAPPAAEPPKDK